MVFNLVFSLQKRNNLKSGKIICVQTPNWTFPRSMMPFGPSFIASIVLSGYVMALPKKRPVKSTTWIAETYKGHYLGFRSTTQKPCQPFVETRIAKLLVFLQTHFFLASSLINAPLTWSVSSGGQVFGCQSAQLFPFLGDVLYCCSKLGTLLTKPSF